MYLMFEAVNHIYIHIPFCEAKCRYCDFNSYAGKSKLIPGYVDALVNEIEVRSRDREISPPETIYFGGGTPSLLDAGDVERILGACGKHFGMKAQAEITLEANPGAIDKRKLLDFRAAGINRLSLGVQSFDDAMLKVLGRIHKAEQAEESYVVAGEAGFQNVNLDLMYALPGQSLERWRSDLDRAVALSPEHLSLYCLTLEEKTPLEREISSGKLAAPDPELAADMYQLAEQRLEEGGYDHYEISNWAKGGYPSRHNLACWHNLPYLGFGAGAHSYADGRRSWNVDQPDEYMERVSGMVMAEGLGPAVEESEVIDRSLEIAETMILGLRLIHGLRLDSFARRFKIDVMHVYGRQVGELTDLGLLEVTEEVLCLTPRGRLLGNEVFSRFLPSG